MHSRFRGWRVTATALAILIPMTAAGSYAAPASAADKPKGDPPRHIAWTGWSTGTDFAAGALDGVVVDGGELALGVPTGTRTYTDPHGNGGARTYDTGTWTSPVVEPGFDLTELVASWNATTPTGTWVEVEARGTSSLGLSKWYVLGRWASGDEHLHRTSVPAQGDDVATVAIDTLVTREGVTLDDYQLRVTLHREAGTTGTPRLSLVGAMASALPEKVKKTGASPSGGAEGIVLDVPTYSQETHIGHYPEFDNGGEAWCSPTSTAMVLDYWNAGPTDAETAWVDPTDADPQVDHAARFVYDYNYQGAGNWPFNTAYAGTRGLEAFVTRLRSLQEAEQFIKAGIPLVVSLSFKKSELDGAGYGTNGHLLVIVGFDENGDVVVNDPASHLIPSNDEVRVTYDREQFESAWVGHSGGISYVIHPESTPLPPAPAEANW